MIQWGSVEPVEKLRFFARLRIVISERRWKNMNRKSRFSAALLAGVLLLGTSACGTQGTASFASPVELTVWTY